MKILVNGVWRETVARELAALLDELSYAETVVATAVNGEFVAASVRAHTALSEGDRVEVLTPVQGG
jgi:sulfur carrier protein